MVRHILVSHCPEGIERVDRMVRFLSVIARSLHLPQDCREAEGRGTERFPPCSLGVRGKMVPVCQHFSSAVGPGAIDPDESGAGKAGVDCAPPGDSRTSQPAVARERQRLRNLWPRTSWPRLNTSRPRICGPQSRAPSVRKISSQPLRHRGIEQSSWGGLGVPVCRGIRGLFQRVLEWTTTQIIWRSSMPIGIPPGCQCP